MSIRLQAVDLSLEGWTLTTAEQTAKDAGVDIAKKDLSTPLKNLTSGTVDGNGVFDRLMKAAKAHLQEEYDSNRISGKEYSQVYLGAMSTVLQTSVQFLLNEQQAHQIAAQIGLIRQQTVTELANTDDNIPIGLGFNFTPQEITPIPSIS